ncbi:SpoIIE family protein phosphatase [Solirubrobacter phytolaccae]|uniref:SpoIIE family protein phosphatase n=1 Tax=Solirubrobacter phytolaccae TaxID=1404360 RepID=A0A9X3NF71_9ACTN|nr:GAF domain-containing SpoIIE family protein phosphatase [Solirubrobacter phytolaccae]MDA0185560.1 SpoIIE family protein phosphatase [Solirubrobacter phytolaccae]
MLRGLEERLRLALEGTETGFWDWDVVTDHVEWSDNMGPLYGLPRGTQPSGIGDFLDRIVHPEDRDRIAGVIEQALREGTSYEFDLRVNHPEQGERWLHARASVLTNDEGATERVIGLLSDVTDRRRREDSRAFLDTISQRFAASMDPVQTLEEVAELAVPRLADWCAVQLAKSPDGDFEQVAVAHVDPEKVRWAWELQARYPPDPESPTGAPAVIRSGRPELYPELDRALLEAAALDEEQIRLVRELKMHSVMVVPLIARGRTLGAITFVWAESGRVYGARDLELAEELGRRAGLALDHARLFAREHRAAEILQRALLPGTLPDLPGYELAVRYVPSDARDHAGGDWYDAFRLPDGRIGIVIGDVGGRGLDAAATMGQLRNALRAYALKGAGPGAVLDDLHTLVNQSADEITFATVVYVVLDLASGACEVATAGHLPPFVTGQGYVDTPPCPPLGFGEVDGCSSNTFTLGVGQTLWLYTDGLVESRTASIDIGLDALAATATRVDDGALEAIAEHLIAALPPTHDDDIALLGLRRVGELGERVAQDP